MRISNPLFTPSYSLFLAVGAALTSFNAFADQSEEEMLAEAQRQLNAQVFGTQLQPQRSELEIYIENARNNNVQPRVDAPSYWQVGYTCAELESRSYIDYRDCMYYYDYYGKYWDYPQVEIVSAPPPKTIVVQRQSTKQVTISSFDEDALEDYYRALKAAVQFVGPISTMTKENFDSMNNRGGFANLSAAWNMMLAQLATAKIELDEWPSDAKEKGWAILGKRITKYNKLFEQHRSAVLSNEDIDEKVRTAIKNVELLTADNLY